MSNRYRQAGTVLVRSTTDPGDLELPRHLDLANPTDSVEDVAWLRRMWSRGEVRDALSMASPALCARVAQLLETCAEPSASARELRRVVLSATFYVLRWQRRATPFGLFAGIGRATVGPRTEARIAAHHRVVLRADAEWLTLVVERLERHPGLRTRLPVTANNAGYVRDGRFIVAGPPVVGSARSPGPLRELSVRLTRPVRAALDAASEPVRFDVLADQLRAQFPRAATGRVDALLHNLIDQHMLITGLRSPMTAIDGLTWLLHQTQIAAAEDFTDLVPLLHQLAEVAGHLDRHNSRAEPHTARTIRRTAAAVMESIERRGDGHVLAADVRLAADVTVPEAVLREAVAAADVLVRLSTTPFGTAAWLDYHARFRARYGPAALVPVRDLLADSGLGYPTGYQGAPRARPAWRMLTERDAALLALIQRANLDGADEIELTEPIIKTLTVGDHADMVAPQRIELGFELHAATANAIDRGQYQLWITAAPRPQSSMAGRFAYLLDLPDRQALTASYESPTDEAVAVQLSFPPRRTHNQNVVRAPALPPRLLSLSEHPGNHPAAAGAISVDDLAVTADAEQMFLLQRSTGLRVVPRVLHALDAYQQSPPLARFLAEVADARSASYGPFDFGAARTLPYTPRIRYGRTVLAPARWMLTAADLPSDHADTQAWDQALQAWMDRWRVPHQIELCQGELRLPLDLDQPLDRLLFQARTRRTERVELRELGRPDRHGWIGRPTQFLVPLTLAAPQQRRAPAVTVQPGKAQPPGHAQVLRAELTGNPARFDDILTLHLPRLLTNLHDYITCWWVGRHRDLIRPDAEQRLSLSLRLTAPEQYGATAAHLGAFADRLRAAGLPAHLTLAPHHPQPGRYGTDTASAEQVFTADSHAAITQIRVATEAGVPAQALAAASLAHIAAAFAPDPTAGYRRLLQVLPHQTGRVDRQLRDHAVHLADEHHPVRDMSGGDQLAAAWRARQEALLAYHHTMRQHRDLAAELRTLLHEHHVRALGVDPQFERTTNRLVRAIAQRQLACTQGAAR
jgi:thiopeptide-type bacteriocin biosynthesis protein